MSIGEGYNMEKKRKQKQYNLPYNIEAAGKNIKWERGEGDRILWKKIKMKKRGWGRILS